MICILISGLARTSLSYFDTHLIVSYNRRVALCSR